MEHHQQSNEKKPQFASILSARANDGRPSDLEFLLRPHCQRLKVVQRLSGAHLMIKAEQSIAVRAYFSCDLDEISSSSSNNDANDDISNNIDDDCCSDDFDNLSSFLRLKVTVIFFILPVEQDRRRQLGDWNSFFQRSQRLVSSVNLDDQNQEKIARVFLLSTAEAAVDALKSIANAITTTSRSKKNRYYEKQHQRYFLPQPITGSIPVSSKDAATAHVAETLREWGRRFDFPDGETDVMLSILGSLGNITTVNGTDLQSLPIEKRSKDILLTFFGLTKEESAEGPSALETSPSPPSITYQQPLLFDGTNVGHEQVQMISPSEFSRKQHQHHRQVGPIRIPHENNNPQFQRGQSQMYQGQYFSHYQATPSSTDAMSESYGGYNRFQQGPGYIAQPHFFDHSPYHREDMSVQRQSSSRPFMSQHTPSTRRQLY